MNSLTERKADFAMISLGHVNIRTADLKASEAFYRDVLGLQPGGAETRPGSRNHVWMRDANGNPCIHLQTWAGDAQTGCDAPGVHHIAFNCSDPDVWRRKLDRMKLDHTETAFDHAGLLQFNLVDPDGVRLELLFDTSA